MSDYLCFLLDENVSPLIKTRLTAYEPQICVYLIGDNVAPPKGTLDPEILHWIEAQNCLLVTRNRASMPVHLHAHIAAGHHVPGIVQLPKRFELTAVIGDLWLIWGASNPDEFQDQIIYLPLRA